MYMMNNQAHNKNNTIRRERERERDIVGKIARLSLPAVVASVVVRV